MFELSGFMLAVSRDALPGISSRRKLKPPAWTHLVSPVRARYPFGYQYVPEITLPGCSTA